MLEPNSPAYLGDCNTYGYTMGRQTGPGMPQQGMPAPQYQATGTGAGPVMAQDLMPMTVANPYFLAGYLQNFIGQIVRVQFSLGTTGAITDKTGQLIEVGATYIALRLIPSNFEVVGDIFSVKFVTLYPLNMV
ncbi:MAG: hypothetical protein ACOYU3_04710 [Bacillota bacterium]